MFDDQIIEQIRQAWVTVATTRNSRDVAASVPAARDLKALLELTFVASTKIEEGEAVKLRLVFFPNATIQSLQQQVGGLDAFSFEQALPLTIENLRKLCPAFDQLTTALAVGKDGDMYCIVGAVLYGRPLSRLDDGSSAHARPQALTLSSRSPGTVAIGYSDGVIGRFENGVFSIAKADAFGSRKLVNHILQTISAHEPHRLFGMEYWYLYRTCLQRLYTTAARVGHGGTILWVPTQLSTLAGNQLRSGFSTLTRQSGSYLAGLALGASTAGWNLPRMIGTERKYLTDYLDMVAKLSCVDGALLIDDHLRPFRFGAHLDSPKWTGEIREGPLREAAAGEVIDTSNFGTRHHSAINFAAAHPGVIAFVVSEDGPVRAISRLSDELLMWLDCLNTVFIDN